MSVERRTIVALSVACLGLIGVTVWALATRDSRTPSSAEGSVYWVAIDGDDAGPGTRDEPWATLQHAADSVGPGATVYVHEGVYEQKVEIKASGLPGRPITFAAAPGERVVLDGSSLEVPAVAALEGRPHVADDVAGKPDVIGGARHQDPDRHVSGRVAPVPRDLEPADRDEALGVDRDHGVLPRGNLER